MKLLHILLHEVGEEGFQDQEGVEEWDVAEELLQQQLQQLALTTTNKVIYIHVH